MSLASVTRTALMGMGMSAMEAKSKGLERADILRFVADSWAPRVPWLQAVSATLPSLALAWAECAFPIVEPTHTLAASLMSTRTSAEYVKEFGRMPWRCFGILIPAGIFGAEEAFELVLESLPGPVWSLFVGDHSIEPGYELNLSEYCELEVVDDNGNDVTSSDGKTTSTISDEEKSEVYRRLLLRGRLIVNTCLEMAGGPIGGGGTVRSTIKTKRGEPRCWSYRLTRPVKVDVRSHVRDFLAHGGKSPAVQSLIRGHWKRQVCGEGRSDRRLIHVEPYWRGPEDAPIAVRSHQWGRPSITSPR